MFSYAVAFPARDTFSQGLSSSFYDEYIQFREIYNAASQCIGEDLHEISYRNNTVKPELHTVCLITHCYALYQLFRSNIKKPDAVIGFSQGEFTAAAVAESLDFLSILQLVYRLEKIIVNSPKVTDGRMARVVELDREILLKCCEEADPGRKELSVAILFSKDQNVVSGSSGAVERVGRLAKQNGARWVLSLGNGGAFHSPLCKEILNQSTPIFEEYDFRDTEIPVYSCIDGCGSRVGTVIRKKLSNQIAGSIVWDCLIHNLTEQGIDTIIELGPGCSISGNTRIVEPAVKCNWVNNIQDLESILKCIGK